MKKGQRRIHHQAANKIRELFAKKQPHSGESDGSAETIATQGNRPPPAPPIHPPIASEAGGDGAQNHANNGQDDHPNPYERQQLRLTRWLVLATIAIALATIVYMGISFYQAKQMQRQVAAMNDQREVMIQQVNASLRQV